MIYDEIESIGRTLEQGTHNRSVPGTPATPPAFATQVQNDLEDETVLGTTVELGYNWKAE